MLRAFLIILFYKNMNEATNDALSITKRYFKLSNAGDLSAIEDLIIDDATYSSAHTGLYFGRMDIMAMMSVFFESYQSLNWQINSIKTISEYITEVHFTFKCTNLSGLVTERTGVERIVVANGLIRHIEVR